MNQMNQVEAVERPVVKSEPVEHDFDYAQPDMTNYFNLAPEIKPFDANICEAKVKTEQNYLESGENQAFNGDYCCDIRSGIKSEHLSLNCEADVKVKSDTVPLANGLENGFKTEGNWVGTLQENPAGNSEHCPYCDFETSKPRFLLLHMRYAHNPNGEPINCEHCDYETRDRRRLNRHKRVRHKQQKACRDDGSMENSSTQNDTIGDPDEESKSDADDDANNDRLLDSLGIVDREESDFYQCPYCSFETKKQRYLESHKRYSHKENGEVFRCEQCQYESTDKRKLTRHIRMRHSLDILSCEQCDFQTRDKTYLTLHINIKHDENVTEYRCDCCDFTTRYFRHLKDHVRNRHVEREEKSMHTCPTCGLQTPSRSYLQTHIRIKHDSSSEVHACPHCPYFTRDKDYYKQHLKVKHDENLKPFTCELCGYTAKLKKQMNRHVRFRHDDTTRMYECHLCPLKTKDKYYFERHNKFIHNDVLEIYRCSDCSFESKYKQHLNRHVRLHHTKEGEVYRCEHCPYTSRNKGNYKEHFKHKHDSTVDILRCEQCDYTTKQGRSLRLHMINMHSASQPLYHCELCNFSTKAKKYLAMHVDVKHADPDILHRCNVCDYATPHKSYLGKHVRRQHGGDRAVSCPRCPYSAKNREALRHHARAKHEPRAASSSSSSATRKDGDAACPHCTFRTADGRGLRRHVKLKHEQGAGGAKATGELHECSVCRFVTKNKAYLKEHRRREHEDCAELRCEHCNFTTKNRQYYKLHVKVKHSAQRDVWHCQFCPFKSFYRSGIKKHLKNLHKDHFDSFGTPEAQSARLESLILNAKSVKEIEADVDAQLLKEDVELITKKEEDEYLQGDSDCDVEQKNHQDYECIDGYGEIDCETNDQTIDGVDANEKTDGRCYNPSIDDGNGIDSTSNDWLNSNGHGDLNGNKDVGGCTNNLIHRNTDDIDGSGVDSKEHLRALLGDAEENMEVDQPDYVTINEVDGCNTGVSILGGLLYSGSARIKTEVGDDICRQFNEG